MRARPRLAILALAALLGGSALAPSASLADGDPASDTLLIQNLYTPVAQNISPPVLAQLESTIKQSNAAGFKVRVALILDRTDLGAVPQLFGHPVQYVHLLAGELYYGFTGAIVAVQPSGIGVRNVKPLAPAQTLVDGVKVATPVTADALAQAADTAVRKLAAQSGKTLAPAGAAAKPTSQGTSSTTKILGGVLIVVLIALFIGQIAVRRRKRAA